MGQIIVSPDELNPYLQIEVGEIKTSITQNIINTAVHQLSLRLAFLSFVGHLLCFETRGNLVGRVFVREGITNCGSLQEMIDISISEGHSIVRVADGFSMSIVGEVVSIF